MDDADTVDADTVDALPLDWSGHVPPTAIGATVPAPRPAADGHPDPALLNPPLARIAVTRARMMSAIALDVVTFTAVCPACGQDCSWVQERRDTKVRSTITCPCHR